MKVFSPGELAEYDGVKKKQIYFAFRGKVYDASGSFLWKGGKHQVLHKAGWDLTGELESAPHGMDLLERLPVIGTLADGADQ
jgi:predicted heme/steroid binding protein